jgi:hypothetical protein
MFYHLLAPLLPESAPILPESTAQSKLVSLDPMPLLYTSLIYHPPLSYFFFPSAVETQFTLVLYKTILRLIDAKSIRGIWGL